MSVRLCYLMRKNRGGMLRSVRLVGQSTDETWPGRGEHGLADGEAGIERAASWVADALSQSRSAGRVEIICLDAEGSVCSWISSPSTESSVVATLARLGPSSNDATEETQTVAAEAVTPITFFAGDELESSIQPLVPRGTSRPHEAGQSNNGLAGIKSIASRVRSIGSEAPEQQAERLAVLASVDLPARLFIDTLDRLGVSVGSVVSIWHAMSSAWDPASSLTAAAQHRSDEGDQVVSEAAGAVAVVLIDPAGRLLWSWSKQGALLAAGSMRLRQSHAAGDGERSMQYGAGEASRLAAEWLSWSVQIGEAPRRVVCVTPPRDDAAAGDFGEALAGAWAGSSVALVVQDDPIGATLSKLAASLEATPPPTEQPADPCATLTDLTLRPGRKHRGMHMWQALFVTAASALIGVVAWQARDAAVEKQRAARVIEAKWRDEVGRIFPDALKIVPGGLGPEKSLQEEIKRREKDLLPPDRAEISRELARPVLEEFETLSLVIASNDYKIDAFDVSSAGVTITVQCNTNPQADAFEVALNRIGGSHIERWTCTPRDMDDGKGGKTFKVICRGDWKPRPVVPAKEESR